MRHRYASRSNKVAGRREVCLANISNEVVAEIRAISQIKNLEDRLQVVMFTKFEVLGDARIELEIGLTP